MICEAFQANMLVAALAYHSAKHCPLPFEASFASSFTKSNRPMSSLGLARTCCSSTACEVHDMVLRKFDSKFELDS